ncbi:hypothetical protein [Microcoleus sp. D2_18a_B4]|uniref:hypothetical protein n=1 Tax=Microcoleus sp. D2_18a_B4 TaxID=3055329 RepID=UPI002FD73B23
MGGDSGETGGDVRSSHILHHSQSVLDGRDLLPKACQLKVKPIVRQGLKPLPQSESPLKED